MKDLAVILAAGRGTRMHSELIKVLHPVLGQPMVAWPIQAARAVGLQPVLVVGHQEDQVRAAFENSDVRFARQPVPRGTGDAVRCALEALPEHGRMVVMAGDAPLFQADTLKQLLEIHGDAKVTVLTAIIDEPAAYGRLIRSPEGTPLRIVEASEANPEELAVQEINTGVYVFDGGGGGNVDGAANTASGASLSMALGAGTLTIATADEDINGTNNSEVGVSYVMSAAGGTLSLGFTGTDGDTAAKEGEAVSAAFSTSLGGADVAIGYTGHDANNQTSNQTDVTISSSLGGGASIFAEYTNVSGDIAAATTTTDATVIALGTSVSF